MASMGVKCTMALTSLMRPLHWSADARSRAPGTGHRRYALP